MSDCNDVDSRFAQGGEEVTGDSSLTTHLLPHSSKNRQVSMSFDAVNLLFCQLIRKLKAGNTNCLLHLIFVDGKTDRVFTGALADEDHGDVGIFHRTEEASGDPHHPAHSGTFDVHQSDVSNR